jgi:outer membrane protein assembly factor BamB
MTRFARLVAVLMLGGAPTLAEATTVTDLFQPRPVPPPATYPGAFDAAPAFHYRVELPGGHLNAASHAEWGDPVVDGEHVYVGAAAGQGLYVLSRRDGSLVRVFPAGNSVEAPPTIVDGVVYFSDTGGNTFAYTVAGQRLWRHDGSAPILSAPAVADGMVVVTNVDDLAVALEADTGTLSWQVKAKRDLTRVAELALYAAPEVVVLPATDDRPSEALLGFSTGTLVGVDLETGEERWRREVGEGRYPDLVSAPVLGGADVYTAGYFEPLVAIDQASHTVRWRLDVGGAFRPVLSDDAAVLYHPATDGSLRAVATLTGAVLWTWESGTTGAITSPRITEAGLVVASSEGSIYLIDPSTGEEVWRWHEPYLLRGVSSVPVVDGRQLLFVSNAGFMYSMLVPVEAPRRRLWP